ncbi:type 2 isopentenyl-diphosphate Delta-isomerase [Alkalihalobacillus sp. AL-G]|uniref:type 2 isopentenyl-diphosphate Delta-isomerase n=1 Tax=Alkalihalobacillus sp. AL-G TaxID=2926399 RepID=UPI00272BA436|nr:type 2 isopentenyl-diphosphate Delta-isomerase [Alkalihalobacillus sp. AL-G]WLD95263.1 type 2 isopentenyl-diphosphate Delta-isomerase [Alkalihalobacillus sp. AL-G]
MSSMKDNQTQKRKNEHIDICLTEPVENLLTTGLENYHFHHNPIPELDFNAINIDTTFLGKEIKAPFLVSSMTGGTEKAKRINEKLAEIAETKGWAIGVGSMRAALESGNAASYRIRKIAPTIPILANIGAVQLNYGYGVEECKRAVDMIEADGLVLHLNSLQEVFQPEGDTDFSNLLNKIEQVASNVSVPVGIKEVGMGINGLAAKRLVEIGVSFIDVAGAGGTSWIQVEKYRNKDRIRYEAAKAFQGWGTPTANCLEELKEQGVSTTVIASGGVTNGVEAAKAIGLGAHLVGFGRTLLPRAVQSEQSDILDQFDLIEFELKATMFGVGVSTINELRNTQLLKKPKHL